MTAEAGKTSILIVDDHPIIRHGLCQLINHEQDLFVCGEAEDADDALLMRHDHAVDAVVAHHAGRDVRTGVLGDGVDLPGHDLADR